MQLPPVLASSLIDCENKSERKKARVALGKQIFYAVNSVFLLRGNYRFQLDPAYGKLLERMHEAKTTNDDRKTINSRVLSKLRDQNIDYSEYEYLVSTVNEKNSHNSKVFLEVVEKRKEENVFLRIKSYMHSKNTKLSKAHEDYVKDTYTDFRKFDRCWKASNGKTYSTVRCGVGNGTKVFFVSAKLKPNA